MRFRLRRSIWDSQLPIIAGRLESAALGTVDRAYYNVGYLMRDLATAPPTSVLSTTVQLLEEAEATVRRAVDYRSRRHSLLLRSIAHELVLVVGEEGCIGAVG
jgi:hypothetical protein